MPEKVRDALFKFRLKRICRCRRRRREDIEIVIMAFRILHPRRDHSFSPSRDEKLETRREKWMGKVGTTATGGLRVSQEVKRKVKYPLEKSWGKRVGSVAGRDGKGESWRFLENTSRRDTRNRRDERWGEARRNVTSREGKVTPRNRRYGYTGKTRGKCKGRGERRELTTWSQRSGRVSDHNALARSLALSRSLSFSPFLSAAREPRCASREEARFPWTGSSRKPRSSLSPCWWRAASLREAGMSRPIHSLKTDWCSKAIQVINTWIYTLFSVAFIRVMMLGLAHV